MRFLLLSFVGSAIGIATAAAMTPPQPHAAPRLTVEAPAPIATPAPAPAPMDSDDGGLGPVYPATDADPLASHDFLNDHEAQARVLMICGLISTGEYQANALEDTFRRDRIGIRRDDRETLRRDRAYIEGEQAYLSRKPCAEIATLPWAREWSALGR